ncbi:hypothetical protein NQ176_g3689 [Zarea fungicola]|uniref:Uncharacterized protein n=1 Tax=Zarea fungicola TaxID=93591 RepID=A0ACC1NIC0_9HYPO|nr:hypothetical protein NQ176_g3689 [Lecanicillium fungicola]
MPVATAKVGQVVVAQAENWEVVEGNIYFPPSSVKKDMLQPSSHSTYCPWKGQASYNDVVADGKTLTNVVWHYQTPSDKAKHIQNYYAFYNGKGVDVEVEE